MKTVKTIVNIIVVILLLPIFASATTGVAIASTVKGESLSLSFVEKSVLTTINIAKSLLNLLKTMACNVISLIFLGITLVESFVKHIVKSVLNLFAKPKKLVKSLFIASKEKMSNTRKTLYAFGLSAFTAIVTKFSISALKAKWAMRKTKQEIVSEYPKENANNVSIDLELKLTEELIQLMNLESEKASLRASVTISKEVAMSVLKSLSSVKMVEN